MEALTRTVSMSEQVRELADAELLDQLEVGLAHRDRATAGLPDVLGALNLHAVEVLFACPDLAGAVRSCPTCGWLGLDQRTCPVDGTLTSTNDDVLEAAVESALDQSATVRLLDRPEIRHRGCAAALPQFPPPTPGRV